MMHWVGRSARDKSGMGSKEMDMAGQPPKSKGGRDGDGPGPWKVPQRIWSEYGHLSIWEWTYRAQIHVNNVYKDRLCVQESL